ncbi:uncharacterized protein LOC128225999 [Mya arenaria]|uniref:uncharacterized protein LOC128225999 n=1 Tax=Mya arenaria TaxID=6604 RepID=UPI0022E2AAF8|nr:uncharacterized protein LOC128225999 [Mya arenaria]
MIIQHSNTTENTTTCCHLETTEYLLHNAPKEAEGPQKNPQEDSTSENTKRATKALRPLQPVDPVDPDELEDPLALPDEIPRDSDSDASSMGHPGTAAPTKKRTIQRITRKLSDAEEVDVIEWIQANPSIFNKAHADYKNTKKRDQLFADKAAQLGEGLTGQDLYKWYLGQRTAFTKLIKRPASGSGTVLMTAQQQ